MLLKFNLADTKLTNTRFFDTADISFCKDILFFIFSVSRQIYDYNKNSHSFYHYFIINGTTKGLLKRNAKRRTRGKVQQCWEESVLSIVLGQLSGDHKHMTGSDCHPNDAKVCASECPFVAMNSSWLSHFATGHNWCPLAVLSISVFCRTAWNHIKQIDSSIINTLNSLHSVCLCVHSRCSHFFSLSINLCCNKKSFTPSPFALM